MPNAAIMDVSISPLSASAVTYPMVPRFADAGPRGQSWPVVGLAGADATPTWTPEIPWVVAMLGATPIPLLAATGHAP